MISLSALGLGGVAAAAAAGWQQIRNMFGYISSFVVVRVTYDQEMSPAVFAYIKRNYKPLPSGFLVYVAHRLKIRGRKEYSLVPFRVPAQTSVYVKGRRIFIVSTSDHLEIRSIRGLTDFDEFTSAALDAWEAMHSVSSSKNSSRFYISKIIGLEKGPGALFSSEKPPRRNSSSSEDESSTPYGGKGSLLHNADVYVDRSFKYRLEDYMSSNEDDPLEGLFFDDEILRYFDQARRWLSLGDWYLERQIPWRRGWLLHGPGGTGKSSIAKAVGQMLGIPVFHFYMATLSDQEFIERWDQMSTPCVALLEDFDNVFHGRENQTAHKSLTFDCVLNQISGVASINGVFLIVTTNHLEHIDSALGVESNLEGGISTRPGRVDSVIKVGYINAHNRRGMAEKILKDWPDLVEEVLGKHDQMPEITPIQWQETLIQAALERMKAEDSEPSNNSNVIEITERRQIRA